MQLHEVVWEHISRHDLEELVESQRTALTALRVVCDTYSVMRCSKKKQEPSCR